LVGVYGITAPVVVLQLSHLFGSAQPPDCPLVPIQQVNLLPLTVGQISTGVPLTHSLHDDGGIIIPPQHSVGSAHCVPQHICPYTHG
jgi:hypothetical protein